MESGPSGNFVGNIRDTSYRRGSFEFIGRGRHARWIFRVVYRFENERLSELIDRTAHVAALTALIETPTAYRYYLAMYVRDVSPFTPFYMAMINPCRRRIVYPSLLRVVRARWNQAFGNGCPADFYLFVLTRTSSDARISRYVQELRRIYGFAFASF